MKHADLNRSIAEATGESVATIRQLGFQLTDPDTPPAHEADELLPRFIDWDAYEDRYWLAEFEQAASANIDFSLASLLSDLNSAMNEPAEFAASVLPGVGDQPAYV